MNVIAKISCHFSTVSYTKIAQRIFTYSDTLYTSITPDKKLNSLIYRTLFYVNIYGSYKLLKTVRFLAYVTRILELCAGCNLRCAVCQLTNCGPISNVS